MVGSTVLPGGDPVSFDLGRHSFYSTLVIEVPRPRQARKAETAGGEDVPASDRRTSFRLATECDVDVFESLSHGRDYLRARGKTLNVSGGGMMVELNKPLLPGTYKFRLHLPNEVLEVAGAVIRNKKQASLTMPVEFVDLHEVERSKLIRFIFQRMHPQRRRGSQKGHPRRSPLLAPARTLHEAAAAAVLVKMPGAPERGAGELPAAELAELNELLWSLPATPDPYRAVAVLLEKCARLFRAPLSMATSKKAQATNSRASTDLPRRRPNSSGNGSIGLARAGAAPFDRR